MDHPAGYPQCAHRQEGSHAMAAHSAMGEALPVWYEQLGFRVVAGTDIGPELRLDLVPRAA